MTRKVSRLKEINLVAARVLFRPGIIKLAAPGKITEYHSVVSVWLEAGFKLSLKKFANAPLESFEGRAMMPKGGKSGLMVFWPENGNTGSQGVTGNKPAFKQNNAKRKKVAVF